jgi:anti-sigma B factor antagonist
MRMREVAVPRVQVGPIMLYHLPMEFYYDEVQHDVLIIKADGGLNGDTANQFVEQIAALIDSGLTRLIIDCTGLDYISSYGIGVIVRLHKRMAQLGGDVKLAGLHGLVFDAIRLVRLDRVWDIYPDVGRALLAFRAGAQEES